MIYLEIVWRPFAYVDIQSWKNTNRTLHKGPFKYYVIKEVGGWGGQMMMFDDKVGGWGWLNDDVSKKYTRKKTLFNSSD